MKKLHEKWRRSTVEKGDILLIHSNITRTAIEYSRQVGYKVGPDEILTSFIEAVGATGTLLFPLFNFDFTKGIPFDIRTTPSHMGALTEAARKHPRAIRTGHPVYSFCAIGHHADKFQNIDNKSAYAEDSPFGILKKMGGKIAVLDLEDAQSMTFYHHVEEVKQVDFRFFKDFSGDYTDAKGISSHKTYSIYVRKIEQGVVSNANPAGALLWQEGLYKGYHPHHDTGLRVINAKKMFDFVGNLIDGGRALNTLYIIKKSP